MNKSNFQMLSEELEQEVSNLVKEVKIRRQLLEKAPGATPGAESLPPFPSNPNVVPANAGFIAGTYGVNADTVVQNPNVLAAVKGVVTRDADRRVARYKPYYSDNLATMMGFGIDSASFQKAKEFISMYSPDEMEGTVAEKDDPEESTALDWKKLNRAVSNYNSQRVKDELIKGNLFRGDKTNPYEQGVADTYQRFYLGKKAQKAVEDTVTNILGKPSRSRGKDVSGYIRQLSQGQKDRMANTWSQNPDQSGKIKFGK